MAEAGVPGFETSLWFALVAPANLPPPIAARLNKEVNAIVSDPVGDEGTRRAGDAVRAVTLQGMADLIRNDLTRWREIAAKAGVKAE